MSYSDALAGRVRILLADRDDVVEKRMFGGTAFLLNGNLCVGVIKDDLIVRVGPDAHAELVVRPHAREMDFSGRPMAGWLYVAPPGVETDADLRRWVDQGLVFAGSLPAKQPKG
jgi:TfoX/Sxy family transcriptional regulator of competence genes